MSAFQPREPQATSQAAERTAAGARRPLRISVFCGAKAGVAEQFSTAARYVGAEIVRRGHTLVCGGGSGGLMGAVADGALCAGGSVIGVMPSSLVGAGVHPAISDLRIVHGLHARKAEMSRLSEAVIALPGGFGTLDELFETLTWAQLGIAPKPVAVLDCGGYFLPLLDFLDHAVRQGFLDERHRGALLSGGSAEEVLIAIERMAGLADLPADAR